MKAPTLLLSLALASLMGATATAAPGEVGAEAPDEIWVASYDGPASIDDRPLDMDVAPDGGRVYVTGQSAGASLDYATVAYDPATGAQVWEARYDAGAYEYASALTVSPGGGRVYVTGRSKGSDDNGIFDYATVAYDAETGAEIWVARYDGPEHGADSAATVETSPDGSRLYVTGWSLGANDANDFATVAYDAATGAELWVTRYDGPSAEADEAFGLAVGPEGTRIYVTGRTKRPGSDRDYATIAYNATTGAPVWVSFFTSPGERHESPATVRVSPNGARVYVTGGATYSGTGRDFITVAYDALTGDQVWAVRYDGPKSETDTARALVLSPDGSTLYVSGRSIWFKRNGDSSALQPDECPWCPHIRAGTWDYATVAYDASTGAQLWVARLHEGKDADSSPSLAVAPDGSRLYLAGIRGTYPYTGREADDYVTVSYNAATGAKVWMDMYDGTANDYDTADAIAISPDGSRLFVTGRSTRLVGGRDITTIAYDLTPG